MERLDAIYCFAHYHSGNLESGLDWDVGVGLGGTGHILDLDQSPDVPKTQLYR